MLYFQPNCTLPPDGVTYVAAPGSRSTLDIFWTSLATIVACTYSVLHLNVPEQRRGKDPGWVGDAKWACRRFGNKLKWCVATVFLPELILVKAIADWSNARKELRLLHQECPHTAKSVSITHMLFADMGGFVLAYHPPKNEWASPRRNQSSSPSRRSEEHELVQATSSAENQPAANTESLPDNETLPMINPPTRPVEDFPDPQTELWHVDALVLRKLLSNQDILLELPLVEDIMDKSKSDVLAKSVIMLQICYFVVTVLVRITHDLPICGLELGTAAFVLCSALTYVATFQKPRSVETAFRLSPVASADTMSRAQKHAKLAIVETIFSNWRTNDSRTSDLGKTPANDLIRGQGGFDVVIISTLLTTTLFSSVHVAGWNLSFPSAVDMWLWRASAIATTAVSAFSMVMSGLGSWLPDWDDYRIPVSVRWPCVVGLLALPVVYGAARLVIIVEMFRGLGYLPPDAFQATWTANVPHIG